MKQTFKRCFYYIYFILFSSNITKLKNKHDNEECYLIADSTELRFIDLTLFDDKPAIMFNMSFMIDDISKRKNVTYAHLVESFFLYKKYNYLGRSYKLVDFIKPLIKGENIVFFTNITNYFALLNYKVLFLFLKLPKDTFTKNLINNQQFNNLSLKTAISLAHYMGFKRAYLIGQSFHSNSLANHWYEDLPIENFKEKRGINANDFMKSKKLNYFFEPLKNKIEIIGVTLTKPKESYFNSITYKELTGYAPLLNAKSIRSMISSVALRNILNDIQYK